MRWRVGLSEAGLQRLGFGALFGAALVIGLVAAFWGDPVVSWRDVDAHYGAMGPDESDTQYDDDFCGAMGQMLDLNPDAYAVWDSRGTGLGRESARDRLALQPEYERHCVAHGSGGGG